MNLEEYKNKVRNYYKDEISLNDKAHDINHCDTVAGRIIKMGHKLFPGNDLEKMSIIAAYTHDLKAHISRNNHHELSSEYIILEYKNDEILSELPMKKIIQISNAVYKHRSSLDMERSAPLEILLFNSDKDAPDFESIVKRSLAYNNNNIIDTYHHIKNKFSKNGYLEYDKWYISYYGLDKIVMLWDKVESMTIDDIKIISTNMNNHTS